MKKWVNALTSTLLCIAMTGCSKKITFTVPSKYIGEEEGETIDDFVEEEKESNQFTDVQANDDGSITYTVTSKQLETLKADYKNGVDTTIEEIVSDDELAVDSIDYDDDMTQFTIYVDSSSDYYSGFESLYAFTFSVIGDYYQIICGVDEADRNVVSTVIDTQTNEEITSITSQDVSEMLEEMEEMEGSEETE